MASVAPSGTGTARAQTAKASPEAGVQGAAEGPAAEGDFWARCKVKYGGDGSVHGIDCPGVRVVLSRSHAPTAEFEKQHLMATMGAGVVVEWVSLAGRQLSQGSLDGSASTRAASPDEGALVACKPLEGADMSACRARIAWIKARGLPPGVIFTGPILAVLGVGLHVPEGCSIANFQRIQCSRAALDWHQGVLSADPVAGYQRHLAGMGGRNFRRGTCVAAGHPGEGMTFEIAQPGRAVTRAEACLASSPEGPPAMLVCIGPRRRDGGYEPPCDQVFAAPPK